MTAFKYDFIVVGAGIFGTVVAEQLARNGKKILALEKRNHIAGNIYSYTDKSTGIEIHKYGSHIFHTESDVVWNYITNFGKFNDYIHTVDTRYNGKLYPMPINVDTINMLYGTDMTGEEAEKFLKSEAKKTGITDPKNFEEKGLSLVGEKLYTAFLKNYTKKQWDTNPKNLPADILSRIPVRFSHNNRYFITAKHQGIPENGYTKLVGNMLSSDLIDIKLNTNFCDVAQEIPKTATIIYCGQIDELFDYKFGVLPYRSLRFEMKKTNNSQGQAVINEADYDIKYTRTHDYKYYQIHQPDIVKQHGSILCREYPATYEKGGEAYYPINTPESEQLYQKYIKFAQKNYPNMIFGGRLGAYRYWDMDKAIEAALKLSGQLLSHAH
ncbi:UDP-galactopyranose mutase [Candidatus Saccharibacteria bacterium]|nr:UDP-galactopyranose mutase [Candidatus Saccharibacteria bacterium]